MRRKIQGLGQPERQRAREPRRLVLRQLHRRGQVRVRPGQGELGEGHAAQAPDLGGQDLRGERLKAVEPDGLADAHRGPLGSRRPLGHHRVEARRVTRLDHPGDRIGKPVEPLLELRPVEVEQPVEHVLGRFGVAQGQVGLQQVQPGGRPVALGVVARGDQLDDRRHVPGRTQVARDRRQHAGVVPLRLEQLLVDREGAGQILAFEARARRAEAGQHRRG